MQKFWSLAHRISWQVIILTVSLLIVGLPSLFVNWMIVDDGYYLLIDQKINSLVSNLDFRGLGDILVERDGGRFRPGLRIYLWFTYLLSGENPVLHHFMNFLISGATVVLIYLIVKGVSSSKTAALVSGLLFLFAPFNLENWYRLQTPEPKVTFFFALSLFFLVQRLFLPLASKSVEIKTYLLVFIPFAFAIFIREFSFAFVFYFVFLLTGIYLIKGVEQNWRHRLCFFIPIGICFSLLPLIANILLKQQGTYTSNYQFSFYPIFMNSWNYLKLFFYTFEPVLLILGPFLFFSWMMALKKRFLTVERFLQFSFFVGFLAFLVILLPWRLPEGRYLEVPLFFLALVLGVEAKTILSFQWQESTLFPKVTRLFLFLSFLLLIFNNLSPMLNYAYDTIVGQWSINKTLSFLAEAAPENSRIYWNLKKNVGTAELVMESNLLLSVVYKRPDVMIEYLDIDKQSKMSDNDLIMSAIVYDDNYLLPEAELQNNRNLNLIKVIHHEVNELYFPSFSPTKIARGFLGIGSQVSFAPVRLSKFETEWKIYRFQNEI